MLVVIGFCFRILVHFVKEALTIVFSNHFGATMQFLSCHLILEGKGGRGEAFYHAQIR